jgi:hypothetical protein
MLISSLIDDGDCVGAAFLHKSLRIEDISQKDSLHVDEFRLECCFVCLEGLIKVNDTSPFE